MEIPLIDFAKGNDKTLAEQIAYAMGHVGFMTVTNIGVQPQAIDTAFSASRDFFKRELSFKNRFLYRDAGENFGYQSLGMESLEPNKPGDLKETFTLRLAPGQALSSERWPNEAFRDTATMFYGDCLRAAVRIMTVMAKAFGLPDDYFSRTVGGENVALRMLYYPAGQTVTEGIDQLGAGAHTDYGILTLLFQDGVSGLEVKDGQGNWQPVPCVPGSVVVNTGDLMHRWTNGRFRSTEHRVKPMTGDLDRFSIAFFVDPDSDTLVEVLPQCIDQNNPRQYAPITAGEHIRQKLELTHN